jgi:L-fuculokinase
VSIPVVAVLDVGKTNKKVILFDRSFRMLAEERTSIETRDFNGVEVEDTETLMTWFRGTLKKFSADYDIVVIAVCAHGATFALVDESGGLAHPVISYTASQGEEVQEEFYDVFGSVEDLHRQTCAADIGFCNMAKVLYYVKTRLPETWARCRHGLFYGPYLGYELTGKMGLEPTFAGNHTYFWDFEKDTWSEVARSLGADKLFDLPMSRPWDMLGTVTPEIAEECGLSPECKVTLGIHDSNANYLPYLAKGYDDFLLNSTGTWCVLMRPAATSTLDDAEIDARVFFNMDALGRPVRTLLMTGGMDYDEFRGFTDEPDESDIETVAKVVSERELFVVPGVLPGGSAFPDATPRVQHGQTVYSLADLRNQGGKPFTDLGQQYPAALNLGLALATAANLGKCGVGKGTTVFIEGGFANNTAYCRILAALCPDQRFAFTSVKEGTSFGTALTGWMLATGASLEEIGETFSIETTAIEVAAVPGLDAYREAFIALANS